MRNKEKKIKNTPMRYFRKKIDLKMPKYLL